MEGGTVKIGRLVPVDLRELWKHEEYDFSAWLEENIDVLSEAIGVPLSVVDREKAVGSFEADLVAQDKAGNLVVIENQLSPSDHDHLGKLITYFTSLEAKTAIWIVSEVRPEHLKAVAWLNESTPADVSFYLVRVAAYRIGDSDPAPLFTVVVGPSETAKAIGKERKELAERHVLRLKFWDQLLTRAREKGVKWHASVSPSADNWIAAGAGRSGFSFVYTVRLREKATVELVIDTGDQERNKRLFDELYARREEIENAFGGPLVWERLDDRRASRVRHVIHSGGLKDSADWGPLQDAMVDAMDRLAKALKPYIQQLPA